MAIESVSSATVAPPPPKADQAAQAAQAQQSRPTPEAREGEGAKRDNETMESRPAPPPVVNSQGQMTGTTISAIA
jgi:hypothetical protein